ncbi:hypothetical protein CJF32_00003232 [Rutstroemia sp. NJR-2017a WRK4]|nr:hypothetical protein CJF32_00003232 [Rutstroemia sp. NJR-2017a WRK4]
MEPQEKPTKHLIVHSSKGGSEGGSSNNSSTGDDEEESSNKSSTGDDEEESSNKSSTEEEERGSSYKYSTGDEEGLSALVEDLEVADDDNGNEKDRAGATESPHQTGFEAPDPLTPCPTWGTPECAEFIGRARDTESSPWLSVYTEEATARKLARVECGDHLYTILVPRLQQAGNRVYNPGLMVYNHTPNVGGLKLEDINDTELFVLHKISAEAVHDLLVLLPREFNPFKAGMGLTECCAGKIYPEMDVDWYEKLKRNNPHMNRSQIGLLAAQEEYFRSITLAAEGALRKPEPKAAKVHTESTEPDPSLRSPTPVGSSDSSSGGPESLETRSKTQPMPAETTKKIIKIKKHEGNLTATLASPPVKQREEMPPKVKPKKPTIVTAPKPPALGSGAAPTPSQSQNKPRTVPPLSGFTIPKYSNRSGRKIQATEKRAAAELSASTSTPTRAAPIEDHDGSLPKSNVKNTEQRAAAEISTNAGPPTIAKPVNVNGGSLPKSKIKHTKKRAAADISTDTEEPTKTTPARTHDGPLPKCNIKKTKSVAPKQAGHIASKLAERTAQKSAEEMVPKPEEQIAPEPAEYMAKPAEQMASRPVEHIAGKSAENITPTPAGHIEQNQPQRPKRKPHPSRTWPNPYNKRKVQVDDPDTVKYVKDDSDDEYSQIGYPHYAPERMRYCSKDHQWFPRSWFDQKQNGRLFHTCRYHGAEPGPVPSKVEVKAELARLEAAFIGNGNGEKSQKPVVD